MKGKKFLKWAIVVGVVLVVLWMLLAPNLMRSRMSSNTARYAAAPAAISDEASARAGQIVQMGKQAASSEPNGDATAGLQALAASQPDRYLIKNGSIVIEAEDVPKARNALLSTLQEMGGYVSNLQESTDSLGRRQMTAQVRVPADKFEATVQRLEPLGKVLNREVTTQDVTEEFVDTDARVRNLKKTEERLLDHLTRVAKIEEILRVEQELTRVREQTERFEGRLRFLTDRIAYSTIQVTLREGPKGESVLPPETFSTAKVTSEATRSLVGFLRAVWVRVIWLAIWAVVWVPLAIIAIIIVRRAMRRAKNVPRKPDATNG